MRLDDGSEISKAEHMAQVLTGKGTVRMVAGVKPLLARVPVHEVAEIDAMASMAQKSRNAMLVYLLEVGLEEVRKQLDDEAAQHLNEETTKNLSVILAGGDEQEVF